MFKNKFLFPTARHKYVISKIDECFPDLDESAIQTFVRKPENMTKLSVSGPNNLILRPSPLSPNPKTSPPMRSNPPPFYFLPTPLLFPTPQALFSGEGAPKIFAHFQSKVNVGDMPLANGEDITKASDPELFFSDGTSIYLNSKCCYFMRVGSKPIDTAVANDASLLYGEISDSPLKTIEVLLSGSYGEMFTSSNEWGKVDDEQKVSNGSPQPSPLLLPFPPNPTQF